MRSKYLTKIICFIFLSNELFAQTAGSLDKSFGTLGKLTTDFAMGDDYANAIAIQADGKIVAVGGTYIPSQNQNFTLARYNINGTLDNSFGTNGKLSTNFGVNEAVAYSVVIQSDGKIIAAGYSYSGTNRYDFSLARYNSNGTLDSSFGINGKVITDFFSLSDKIFAISLQPDGKIVVGGYAEKYINSFSLDFALARYNGNGSLDLTFGSNGKVTTDVGYYGLDDIIYSIGVQTDGKIVAVGRVRDIYDFFGIVRYKSNGSLDSTFNGTGILNDHMGNATYDGATSVTIQADSKILVSGSTSPGLGSFIGLARYNPNGSRDMNFGTNGCVVINTGCYNDHSSIAQQSDGKILIAANSIDTSGTNDNFGIIRLNINGTLDNSFGKLGSQSTDFNFQDDYATSIGIAPDGKIVVAGFAKNNLGKEDFALARYHSVFVNSVDDFSAIVNSVYLYPNPVHQSSEIEYNLIYARQVAIKLFDVNGRLIRTYIENEKEQIGKHTHHLDFPENLQEGNYYIQLIAGDKTVSIKILK